MHLWSVIALTFAVAAALAPAVAQHINAFQQEFEEIVDLDTVVRLVEQRDYPFAHEAGVYLEKLDKVVFVSNIRENRFGKKFVEISSLDIGTNKIATVNAESILMANGAAKASPDTLVFASQGLGEIGGSVISLNMETLKTTTVVNNWHDLKFSSPNDVIKIEEGKYLWTDPPYAFAQKFRTGKQQVAPYVWYHNAKAGITQPILDGFVKPNGLCLSPDRRVLYVSDTGFERGDGKTDINAPKSVYAYDIQLEDDTMPAITNRRLFAVPKNGIPDGLKVDTKGNLYAGVGDGVEVFNPKGVLIGKILTPSGTGVGNLVFAKDTLYFFAETHLYAIKLKVEGHRLD